MAHSRKITYLAYQWVKTGNRFTLAAGARVVGRHSQSDRQLLGRTDMETTAGDMETGRIPVQPRPTNLIASSLFRKSIRRCEGVAVSWQYMRDLSVSVGLADGSRIHGHRLKAVGFVELVTRKHYGCA